jgi:hypothetical protein
MRRSALVEHVRKRLDAIQRRHNFNPQRRASQVRHLRHLPDVITTYGEFVELVRLIDKLGLHIPVPYDPAGLKPTQHHEARALVPIDVYFARKDNTTFWKIGSSIHPLKRVRSVATGNDGPLTLIYTVRSADGRALERQLKKHLQPFKTRDRHHLHKGEWFDLDPRIVQTIVRRLRAGSRLVST